MKTRKSLVSNSSSSSFVIVLDQEPKSWEDVYEQLYDSEPGTITGFEPNHQMSHEELSKNVWSSIQTDRWNSSTYRYEYLNLPEGQTEPRLIDILTDEFSGLYQCCSTSPLNFWDDTQDKMRVSLPIHEVHFYNSQSEPWFATDTDTLEKYAEFTHQEKNHRDILNKKERALYGEIYTEIGSQLGRAPLWSQSKKKGLTWDEHKELIKPWNDLEKQLRESTCAAQVEALEEERKAGPDWTVRQDYCEALGKADAEKFLEDNKDKFIFIVEYHDNEEWPGSLMEHGNIFFNVPHVRFSHH
jgi:hypothetical protein